jgi:hypothetical protein
MSDSCVLAIEPLCVDSIEELHPARQVGFRRFDMQVVMVAHKAVPMTDPAVPNDDITENLRNRARSLSSRKVSSCAFHTAGNVVEGSFVFQS